MSKERVGQPNEFRELTPEEFAKQGDALRLLDQEIKNFNQAVNSFNQLWNVTPDNEKNALNEVWRRLETQEQEMKNKIQERGQINLYHDPYTILELATKEATKDGNGFNKDIFKSAMKKMLLGNNFDETVKNLPQNDKIGIQQNTATLDKDLNNLADAVNEHIKTNSIEKNNHPQKSSTAVTVLKTFAKVIASVIIVAAAVLLAAPTVFMSVCVAGEALGAMWGPDVPTKSETKLSEETRNSKMESLIEKLETGLMPALERISENYSSQQKTNAPSKDKGVEKLDDKTLQSVKVIRSRIGRIITQTNQTSNSPTVQHREQSSSRGR